MKNQIFSSILFTLSFISLAVSMAAMPIGGLNENAQAYSPNIAIWMGCSLIAVLISSVYLGAVLNSDNN